jgi:hypothetical protein
MTLSMKDRDIDLAQLLEYARASAPRPPRRKAQPPLLLPAGDRRDDHLRKEFSYFKERKCARVAESSS